MGLITFLGLCTPTWCYVRDGVGWGRMGLITFLGACTPTWCYVRDAWGGVGCCYVDVTLIEYVVALAHTKKKLEQMEANRFCPKRQMPWRNQRKSLEVGAKLPVEARCFHHKFHFGRTSHMLVAELRKDSSKPFGHGISWINRHFHFFPGVVTK